MTRGDLCPGNRLGRILLNNTRTPGASLTPLQRDDLSAKFRSDPAGVDRARARRCFDQYRDRAECRNQPISGKKISRSGQTPGWHLAQDSTSPGKGVKICPVLWRIRPRGVASKNGHGLTTCLVAGTLCGNVDPPGSARDDDPFLRHLIAGDYRRGVFAGSRRSSCAHHRHRALNAVQSTNRPRDPQHKRRSGPEVKKTSWPGHICWHERVGAGAVGFCEDSARLCFWLGRGELPGRQWQGCAVCSQQTGPSATYCLGRLDRAVSQHGLSQHDIAWSGPLREPDAGEQIGQHAGSVRQG